MRLGRLPHYTLSIFVLLICTVVCVPVSAQVVSVAQINGTVKDPSDASVRLVKEGEEHVWILTSEV